MTKSKVITVRLTEEQFGCLEKLRLDKEAFLGIDVPMGVLVRRLIDVALEHKKSESNRVKSPNDKIRQDQIEYIEHYNQLHD